MHPLFRSIAAFLVLMPGLTPPLNAQWEHINGTGILNVVSYASIGSKLFTSVNSRYDSGGVIVSTDNGATWSAASGGLPVEKILSLRAIGNSLGQLIATLVNGENEPGEHTVRFDGSHLPSGVYLYRLQAGSFV